ncbi:hypothetical protein CYJ99_05300 [Neisseria perflava]|uniref:Uncharacterized protein n=1 Tax=Neisseria perflava TaxID=33053 RepID=A0A9X7F586_NEIPE|nr:hypothetical protein [Neisseria perflava]PLA49955.1 hypothetical protein CYJ99_05300 [Neisseria perflava]WOS97711.1 hypothetical protein CYJ98_009055 [Neisseria perflava]
MAGICKFVFAERQVIGAKLPPVTAILIHKIHITRIKNTSTTKKKRPQPLPNKRKLLPYHRMSNSLPNGSKSYREKKKYSVGDNEGSQYFKELETDLKQAATDGRLSSQDRQQITEQLALKPVLQKHQPNWLTSKREKSIKELLKALQNNSSR